MPSIDPTKTALRNKQTSQGFSSLYSMLDSRKQILDYGSGYLRHASALVNSGHTVSIYDLPEILSTFDADSLAPYSVFRDEQSIPCNTYDAALCIFVLNTMPDIADRVSAVRTVFSSLVSGGLAVFEVRSYIDAKYKEPYRDGMLVGKNKVRTFQKPYSKKELLFFVQTHANFSLVSSGGASASVHIVVRKD